MRKRLEKSSGETGRQSICIVDSLINLWQGCCDLEHNVVDEVGEPVPEVAAHIKEERDAPLVGEIVNPVLDGVVKENVFADTVIVRNAKHVQRALVLFRHLNAEEIADDAAVNAVMVFARVMGLEDREHHQGNVVRDVLYEAYRQGEVVEVDGVTPIHAKEERAPCMGRVRVQLSFRRCNR